MNEDEIKKLVYEIDMLRAELRSARHKVDALTDENLKFERAKDTFLASVSHEFKTPLNAVIGFADLLKETQLNYVQTMYVDTISDRGRYLYSLIQNILEKAEMTYSQREESYIPVDNHSFVSDSHTSKRFLRNIDALIVEDNSVNALMMCEAISRYGAKVDTAPEGQKAVEMVSRKNYDVVFMDVMMPLMDGVEATLRIRQNVSQTLPIIGVSAASMKADVDRALNAGMNAYLSKPVDFDCLLDVVNGILA